MAAKAKRGGPLPGVAPLRGRLAWDWRREKAGRAAGHDAGADGVGGRRHRLPQRRRPPVGVQRQYRARWARRPTASSGCRSTPTPSRQLPAGRRLFLPESWEGRHRRGGQPASAGARCDTGKSGSWCWICWKSWRGGGCASQCWCEDGYGDVVRKDKGWKTEKSTMWYRTRKTTRRKRSRSGRRRRRTTERDAARRDTARGTAVKQPMEDGKYGRRGADLAASQQGPAAPRG